MDNPEPAMTDEELDAKLFDYYEGTLSAEDKARVEAVLAARGERPDPELRQVELSALKVRREAPPPAFTAAVTETIHRRSAGRFFARRTLGDRVPFTLLLVLALLLGLAVVAILWSSSTGSLRVQPEPTAAPPPVRGIDIAPTP